MTLPKGDVVVVGVGARTHTGMTALEVAMSARAGKMFPRDSHLTDRAGEPMSMCRVASIADNVMGLPRFVALGAPPLAQAAHAWMAAPRLRLQERPALPVILALPSEHRPGFDARLLKELLPALAEQSKVPIDHARSALVTKCRGGGAIAFKLAIERLRAGQDHAIAVGGIDSYFDPDILEHLDREMRLHSLTCENGFIPGEGAGFVVLAARRQATSMHRYAQVLNAASELEPRPYGSAEPCHALGMTLTLKKAIEPLGLQARRIPWLLTDVANERHRVDEFTYAKLRLFRALTDDAIHDQPLLRTGDLGAASAAVLLVMACIGWQTGCALGDCAVIATHSDGPERGALLASMEPAS